MPRNGSRTPLGPPREGKAAITYFFPRMVVDLTEQSESQDNEVSSSQGSKSPGAQGMSAQSKGVVRREIIPVKESRLSASPSRRAHSTGSSNRSKIKPIDLTTADCTNLTVEDGIQGRTKHKAEQKVAKVSLDSTPSSGSAKGTPPKGSSSSKVGSSIGKKEKKVKSSNLERMPSPAKKEKEESASASPPKKMQPSPAIVVPTASLSSDGLSPTIMAWPASSPSPKSTPELGPETVAGMPLPQSVTGRTPARKARLSHTMTGGTYCDEVDDEEDSASIYNSETESSFSDSETESDSGDATKSQRRSPRLSSSGNDEKAYDGSVTVSGRIRRVSSKPENKKSTSTVKDRAKEVGQHASKAKDKAKAQANVSKNEKSGASLATKSVNEPSGREVNNKVDEQVTSTGPPKGRASRVRLFGELYELFDDPEQTGSSASAENSKEDEVEEKEDKNGKRGTGEPGGKRRGRGTRAVLIDNMFTSFLGRTPGYTDEEDPEAMRNARNAAGRRGAKKVTPRTSAEVARGAVEGMLSRLADRGGACMALSSIEGAWPTSKPKFVTPSSFRVSRPAAPLSFPTLTAQEIHDALEALSGTILPREIHLFRSRGLLCMEMLEKKDIAGTWTAEKLLKKYNLPLSKPLRGALAYGPTRPCQDFIKRCLCLSESPAVSCLSPSSSSMTGPVYRLPCAEDMDSLIFRAVRLRDTTLQQSSASQLRVICEVALSPLQNSIDQTVCYDAFWRWRPSLGKFLSLLDRAVDLLEQQREEQALLSDGSGKRKSLRKVQKSSGSSDLTADMDAVAASSSYCSVAGAISALGGALECINVLGTLLCRARLDDKDAELTRTGNSRERCGGDTSDSDEEDLHALAVQGVTSVRLAPLLLEQLSLAGLDAETAFFVVFAEALRMVRVYLDLALEDVDEDEDSVASTVRLTALVRKALEGVCRVLTHLHVHLRAHSGATISSAIALVRRKVPGLLPKELVTLSHFCVTDPGLTPCGPSPATPDVGLFLKRLALTILLNDPSVNTNVSATGSKRKRMDSTVEGEERETRDLEQSLLMETFVQVSLLSKQENEEVKERVPALFCE